MMQLELDMMRYELNMAREDRFIRTQRTDAATNKTYEDFKEERSFFQSNIDREGFKYRHSRQVKSSSQIRQIEISDEKETMRDPTELTLDNHDE